MFSSGITIALFQARLARIESEVSSAKELSASMTAINTKLEVMQNDVGHIKEELDDEKRWREHVQGQAEVPIHVGRKR